MVAGDRGNRGARARWDLTRRRAHPSAARRAWPAIAASSGVTPSRRAIRPIGVRGASRLWRTMSTRRSSTTGAMRSRSRCSFAMVICPGSTSMNRSMSPPRRSSRTRDPKRRTVAVAPKTSRTAVRIASISCGRNRMIASVPRRGRSQSPIRRGLHRRQFVCARAPDVAARRSKSSVTRLPRGLRKALEGARRAPARGCSRFVLLGDLKVDVAVVVDGEGDQVGSTTDCAVLGEGLPTATTRIREDFVLLAAKRAAVRDEP